MSSFPEDVYAVVKSNMLVQMRLEDMMIGPDIVDPEELMTSAEQAVDLANALAERASGDLIEGSMGVTHWLLADALRTRDLVRAYTSRARRTIGERLQEIREKKGLTAEALGKKLGITGGAVRHVENGRRPATTDRIEKWAQACGHRLEYALLPSEGETPFLDLELVPHPGRVAILRRAYLALLAPNVPGYLLQALASRVESIEIARMEHHRAAVKKPSSGSD